MKMPKAKKLPSGSWYVRVRVNGRDISITRPTEKEAVAEAVAVKHGIIEAEKKPEKLILKDAIDRYVDIRRNILSPSTIRGYMTIRDNRFKAMMEKDVFGITNEQWQRAVNLEAKIVSAKTLANAWGLIASVVNDATGSHPDVDLPQVIVPEKQWLRPKQIPEFVSAIKGDPAEIPALLALSSLRRSEITALRWSDIDFENGVLRVNGAAVPDEHHKIVRKQETKNKTSRRVVPIIPPLMDALKNVTVRGEYVVTCHPATAMERVNRFCEANGFPKVGLHGLRHSFASLAYHLKMPEKIAMEIGGWANDQTMHKIYTHIAQDELTTAAKSFTDFFIKKGKNDDENGDE